MVRGTIDLRATVTMKTVKARGALAAGCGIMFGFNSAEGTRSPR